MSIAGNSAVGWSPVLIAQSLVDILAGNTIPALRRCHTVPCTVQTINVPPPP